MQKARKLGKGFIYRWNFSLHSSRFYIIYNMGIHIEYYTLDHSNSIYKIQVSACYSGGYLQTLVSKLPILLMEVHFPRLSRVKIRIFRTIKWSTRALRLTSPSVVQYLNATIINDFIYWYIQQCCEKFHSIYLSNANFGAVNLTYSINLSLAFT